MAPMARPEGTARAVPRRSLSDDPPDVTARSPARAVLRRRGRGDSVAEGHVKGHERSENVRNITAAVHGVYGALDERINAGIPAINEALHAANVTHALKQYDGAGHSFMSHTSETRYVPEAAQAAWADTLA